MFILQKRYIQFSHLSILWKRFKSRILISVRTLYLNFSDQGLLIILAAIKHSLLLQRSSLPSKRETTKETF